MTSLVLLMLGATLSKLPVGCLIIVGDHTQYCGVVHKLDDGVRLVVRQTFVGGEGIKEGAHHNHLRGPVLRVKMEEVVFPNLTLWGLLVKKFFLFLAEIFPFFLLIFL